MGRPKGKCVFCGAIGRMTRDHIPPECLFVEPYPLNLVTVPCCERCRKKHEKDDEYFCHRILLRDDIGHRADVTALQPSILRALAHPRKRGYRAEFDASLVRVELTTLSGLYLRTAPAYGVNNLRLDSVVSRIVRGLYFHETRRRLPLDYEASAWSIEGFPAGFVPTIERNLIRPLLREKERVVGNRVFAYRFQRATDASPHTTAWCLVFFEKVVYIGMTLLPPEGTPSGLTVEPHSSIVSPRRR